MYGLIIVKEKRKGLDYKLDDKKDPEHPLVCMAGRTKPKGVDPVLLSKM